VKKLIISLLFAIIASIMVAQAPQAINYQAIARDATNNPIVQQQIGVQFRILQGSVTGTQTYGETWSVMTNQFGLFNLPIGKGTLISGSGIFSAIDWFISPYFLEVAIIPPGSSTYQIIGTSELLSVPYALYAGRAPKISDGDGDTWIDPDATDTDLDEIHMSLGLSPGSTPGIQGPTVLILRKNTPIPNRTANTMLEIIDPSLGKNTFVGDGAGRINSYLPQTPSNLPEGELNTAFGYHTLRHNDKGNYNTAIGAAALSNLTDGSNNTAIGLNALVLNSSGGKNTALGVGALYSSLYNSRSTALGYYAMFRADNNSGSNPVGRLTYNTAVGYEALIGGNNEGENTGQYNTAVGDQALSSNESGEKNTSIGANALFNNTKGSSNTAIGYAADVDITMPNLTNATAIGANAKVTTKDAMILGKDVNVGIGLSGNPVGPANRLEINAALPDASGLRFRRLNSGSPFTPKQISATTSTPVLSLDQSGDVILVGLKGSGGGGGNYWDLNGNLINPSTDYLGTNSADPLKIKTSGIHSGIIDPLGQVFLGFQAGLINTVQSNTGIGYQALKFNSVTGDNTAMGYQALTNNGLNATGDQAKFNTAIGSGSLFSNTVGKGNTAIGYNALNSTLNNDNNTAIGSEALRDNVSGTANTATGVWALHENNSGSYNTAYGTFAMTKNQGGGANTAMGVGALDQNVSGSNNTAIGVNSLERSTGNFNTATGWQALRNNKADGNTANGVNALEMNTTGTNNTAVGVNALKSNSNMGGEVGSWNTAMGADALISNIWGVANTAVGAFSLRDNVQGFENTAVGVSANETSQGNRNTAIGYGATTNNFVNSIAIGHTATVNNHNKVRIGNTSVSVFETQTGVWQASDGRFKEYVKDDVHGLDFIMRLHPVSYNFNRLSFAKHIKEKTEGRERELDSLSALRSVGFIAQDVEKLIQQTGFASFDAVHTPANETDNYSIAYSEFVVPLVKAIQEQQVQIDVLKSQNAELKDLKVLNLSMQSQITKLQTQFQALLAKSDKSLER